MTDEPKPTLEDTAAKVLRMMSGLAMPAPLKKACMEMRDAAVRRTEELRIAALPKPLKPGDLGGELTVHIEHDVTNTLPLNLEAYEKACIERALHENKGNRLAAAHALGVGKSTLYRKITKYGFQGLV